MMSTLKPKECYQALINRDAEFDGVVYFGIRTTGIFCRPVCSARHPRFENCEFFPSAEEALLAGYRPCKRCRPVNLPGEADPVVKQLIDAVEENPERRWSDSDFRELGIDSSTVRRKFKKRFGMTFVSYARARRMGLAIGEIRSGKNVLQAQLHSGFESSSGFRDAFTRIMGSTPSSNSVSHLISRVIDTRLGPMLAIADDTHLLLLEFTNRRGLEREIERLGMKTRSQVLPGTNPILESIGVDLKTTFRQIH
ncbi:MAG: bifunctional transcriptional activator/DNA repair enzyme AdaA [Pirellulaceae bacterium]